MIIVSLAATLAFGAFDVFGASVATGAAGAFSAPDASPNRCTVGPLRDNPEGYFWPLPNIRAFVDEAELIVRARATALGPPLPLSIVAARLETSIQFVVLEVLKGDSARTRISVPGETTRRDDFNNGTVPYRMVRQGGRMGNCVATSYKLGAEYLLLLKTKNDVLNPYWAALAPLNEQITGSDDAWVTWVREQME